MCNEGFVPGFTVQHHKDLLAQHSVSSFCIDISLKVALSVTSSSRSDLPEKGKGGFVHFRVTCGEKGHWFSLRWKVTVPHLVSFL